MAYLLQFIQCIFQKMDNEMHYTTRSLKHAEPAHFISQAIRELKSHV
jgi:hypothetical protein